MSNSVVLQLLSCSQHIACSSKCPYVSNWLADLYCFKSLLWILPHFSR